MSQAASPGEGEKQGPRRSRILPLIGLPLLAAAFRLSGLSWGLPDGRHYFSYHPDELPLLLPAITISQGDWNPHFFNYGTLYIYLVGIPAVIFGIVPDSVPFPQGLAPLYLTGRILAALLGTATVPLLYLALRREGRSLALGSALLLTICPLHVINSHYATVDVPATFFLVVAFLFALRGAERATLKNATLTGLFVGLAAATKYNAGLFLLPALLAPVLVGQERVSCPGPRKRKLGGPSWWLGLPAGALVAFLVCNPWIGTPEFRQGFLFEWRHAQAGGTFAFVGTGSGWSYHLLHGLPVALGYPLLAAVIIGFVLAFRSKSPAFRLSLVWCLFYFAIIGFGKERFIRYLVPMMPFVCVLAASLWVSRLDGGPEWRQRRGPCVLAAAVLGLTGLYSLGQLIPLLRLDPRDASWVSLQTLFAARADASDAFDVRLVSMAPGWRQLATSRPRARIGLVSVPWYYDPPVSPYNAGAFSQPMFEQWNRETGSRIAITGWEVDRLRQALPVVFLISDLEVADLQRLGRADVSEFLATLDATYGRAAYKVGRRPFSWLAPPRDRQPPDWLYTVPQVTMYYGARR